MFGIIGDIYGALRVIQLSFLLMAITSVGICVLPTYEMIGPLASIGITVIRMMQGWSTVGAIIGGEIYLSNYFKGRKKFIAVPLLTLASYSSCQVALYAIDLVLEGYFNWRYLFIGGLAMFTIGYINRRNLIESSHLIKHEKIIKQVLSLKTYIALFFIYSMSSIGTYISFIGINMILREEYHYSFRQLIDRNLLIGVVSVISLVVYIVLAYKYNPYKINIVRAWIGLIVLAWSPVLFIGENGILILQLLLPCFVKLDSGLITPIVYENISVERKFTIAIVIYAISKAFALLASSLGVVWGYSLIGDYFTILLGIPFIGAYLWGVRHFKELEEQKEDNMLKEYDK